MAQVKCTSCERIFLATEDKKAMNSNKRGAGDRRKVKIKIQKMKPRRNAATTGPRNSTLQTVRTLPDISECSSDNLLEQLKYFAENPVDNLDMIVSISSRLYLKITSQDKTSKDKVLDKIRRGKREFYPLFLKLIEVIDFSQDLWAHKLHPASKGSEKVRTESSQIIWRPTWGSNPRPRD
ncbi:hypothetical protein M8J77_023279 [Diaphorina citri]|nr:hypothetical protein M8J77_023279 [Diaphorina citri]